MFEIIGVVCSFLFGFILVGGIFIYIDTIFTDKSRLLSEIEYLRTENIKLTIEILKNQSDNHEDKQY